MPRSFFDWVQHLRENADIVANLNSIGDQMLKLVRARKPNPNFDTQFADLLTQATKIAQAYNDNFDASTAESVIDALSKATQAIIKMGRVRTPSWEQERGINPLDPDTTYQVAETLYGYTLEIKNKLDAAQSPTHQKIISENPSDRQRYLIAADNVEESGGDEYIATILRAIGNGKPKEFYALYSLGGGGTLTSPQGTVGQGNYLIANGGEEKSIFPMKVRGMYQHILGIKDFGELYIARYFNTPPRFNVPESVRFISMYTPGVNHQGNWKSEFVRVLKNICTKLNNGDTGAYAKFVDEYMENFVKLKKLLASRSKTRYAATEYDIEYQRGQLMRLLRPTAFSGQH